MTQTIKMITHNLAGFETVEIYPISDLHIGSPEFNEPAFQKISREIMEQPNRFCVILGDIVDNGIKSAVTNIYDATMQPREQRAYAAELLHPIKDRILCMTSGNHCYRSRKETDTDPAELVASKLNIEHLYQPDLVFLKITTGRRTDHCKRPPNYCIGVTHGAGGGMLIGAGLNKSEPLAITMGVDLMITGHTHRPMTAPTMRFECDMAKGVMVAKEIRLLVSTGYLDYAGYASRKMLKPVSIRPNKAILNCREFDISVLS